MTKGKVVEFGHAGEVMSNPQHDYTKLLLDSIPTTTKKWRASQAASRCWRLSRQISPYRKE